MKFLIQNKENALKMLYKYQQSRQNTEDLSSRIHRIDTEFLISPLFSIIMPFLTQSIQLDLKSRKAFIEAYKIAILDFVSMMVTGKLFEDGPDPIIDLKFLKEDSFDCRTKVPKLSRDATIFLSNKLQLFLGKINSKLSSNLSTIDEEDLRELYLDLLKFWFYFSIKDLSSVELELQILRMRESSQDGCIHKNANSKQNLREAGKARVNAVFIKSKDDICSDNPVLGRFPGAAPPTYSVEQFYDQLKRRQAKEASSRPVPVDKAVEKHSSDEDDVDYYDNYKVYELRKEDVYHDGNSIWLNTGIAI